jgi:dephospho-CoA kinase
MATQAPRAERLAAADDVIDNSRDFAWLERQARALHERYLGLASSPASTGQ